MDDMAATLEKTTGKSLDHWMKLVLKSGRTKHGEVVSWLKSERGVTHGYAGRRG